MKGSIALLALAGAAIASPYPQASAPAGCSPDRAGTFTITVNNVTTTPAKRDLVTRQQLDGVLTLTLQGGILKDQAGRTGYIAANRQFQFDNPIQAGAVITSGWSVCSNGSLALSGSAIFYQCLSGNFYNLYDRTQGGQCGAIYIVASGASQSGAATQMSDGQPQATTQVSQISDGQIQATTATAKVTQISDGQIQATTGRPVTQISDGQIQASTGRPSPPPVTQISDGQIQAPTGRPVTQISDGQVQATTGRPVTQISDGQIQATTGRPVTQISDGQIQATTGRPVTQISDGQIQATTARPSPTTGRPVTQISDGQIQATTGRPVTQISDGQIQATTGSAPIATFTGAAQREMAGSFAFVAGIVGAVALL